MSRNFSSQINQRTPTATVDDIVNNRYDNVHRQLYAHALDRYFSYAAISPDDYHTLELPSSYFDSPSKVKLVRKEYPYKSKVIDLTPYWEEYKFSNDTLQVMIDDDTVNSAEIKYKDYVRGTAEMQSRLTGVKFNISLKDVNDNMNEYPDEHTVNQTFGYKVINKIYGE